MTADDLARFFHETYERLAPSFGYETRKESAVPWEDVPEKNKALMIAVCEEVIDRLECDRDDRPYVELPPGPDRTVRYGGAGLPAPVISDPGVYDIRAPDPIVSEVYRCEGCGRRMIYRETKTRQHDLKTGERVISKAWVCPRYDRQWRNLWLGGWRHYGTPIIRDPDGSSFPAPMMRLEWR